MKTFMLLIKQIKFALINGLDPKENHFYLLDTLNITVEEYQPNTIRHDYQYKRYKKISTP